MSERPVRKTLLCCLALVAALAVTAGARGAEFRDPTRPPAAVQAPTSTRTPQVKAPDWRLSSILIAPDRRVAVISGQALVEGEVIDGARVVKITPAEVLLRRGKREYTLKLTPDRLKVPSTDYQEGK